MADRAPRERPRSPVGGKKNSRSSPPPGRKDSRSSPPVSARKDSRSSPPVSARKDSRSSPPVVVRKDSRSSPPVAVRRDSRSSPPVAVRRDSRSSPPVAVRKDARTSPLEKLNIVPLFVVDREKTCPMLLRVYCNMGRHHRSDEFSRHNVPSNELQIYTWLDCSLRELMSLVREVNPETRQKGTMFSFSTVYPDPRRGGYRFKDLGQTCSGRKGEDDDITLHSKKFQIGDFIDVAISLRSTGRGRPY